jgi:flavin reductase (DIM6/NTAB) family NADH-FMN oxidoreductase RutF
VNVLAEHHDQQCFAFSGKMNGPDRFNCGTWRDERGLPLLADAQANLFCEVEREIPFATHTIFIGRVVEVRNSGGARPLIYLDGRPGRASL